VDFYGGSNERVPGLHRAAQGFTPGHKPSARIRYLKVNRQDSSHKARAQVLPQPSIETVASSADREAFNAVANSVMVTTLRKTLSSSTSANQASTPAFGRAFIGSDMRFGTGGKFVARS